MPRRAVLFVLLAGALLLAGDRDDALEAVAPLASALSESDARAFLQRVPEDAPDRAELRANVEGLIAAAEVTSSVEVRTAGSGAAELDWYMEIRSRATRMLVERRRGIVRVRFAGRKLRSIEPASFFAPPK